MQSLYLVINQMTPLKVVCRYNKLRSGYLKFTSSSTVRNILVGLLENTVSTKAFSRFEKKPSELLISPILFVTLFSVSIRTT